MKLTKEKVILIISFVLIVCLLAFVIYKNVSKNNVDSNNNNNQQQETNDINKEVELPVYPDSTGLNIKDDNGFCVLNCDTNNDDICDKNCDTDGDGIADVNIGDTTNNNIVITDDDFNLLDSFYDFEKTNPDNSAYKCVSINKEEYYFEYNNSKIVESAYVVLDKVDGFNKTKYEPVFTDFYEQLEKNINYNDNNWLDNYINYLKSINYNCSNI